MWTEVLWNSLTEDAPTSRVLLVSISAVLVTYGLVHWLAPDYDLDNSDESKDWTMALP